MKWYSVSMKILSIETSCDETGISILESASAEATEQSGEIALLGNALASQIALHAQYGGVFPAMAKRAHAEKIVPLILDALAQAGLLRSEGGNGGNQNADVIKSLCTKEEVMAEAFIDFFNSFQKPDIDSVAVTVGPGLEPALWVGINAAKVLSIVWDIPVIPVNHMEGHVVTAAVIEHEEKARGHLYGPDGRLVVARKEQKDAPDLSTIIKSYEFRNLQFPLLALLVSGGHTELVLTKNYGQYEKIGQTRDDAVGEAFDKVARMLGLPYPGGPAVSKMAKEFRLKDIENSFELPRPMLHSQDYDFSFSGIKTAVLYTIRDLGHELSGEEKLALAAAFEDAVVEVLIKKTIRAAEEFHIQTIVVGGGVSGNNFLKEQLTAAVQKKIPRATVLFPEPWLATDNAIMIGLAAFARVKTGSLVTQDATTLRANGNLSISE
jgi:N6-L-threonylcarbamoyladenine synthase